MKNIIQEIQDSMMDGHLRDVFEAYFPKDQEAIDGLRTSNSNRAGALVYQAEVYAALEKAKLSLGNSSTGKTSGFGPETDGSNPSSPA